MAQILTLILGITTWNHQGQYVSHPATHCYTHGITRVNMCLTLLHTWNHQHIIMYMYQSDLTLDVIPSESGKLAFEKMEKSWNFFPAIHLFNIIISMTTTY